MHSRIIAIAALIGGLSAQLATGAIFSVDGIDDTISTIDPDTGAVLRVIDTPVPAHNSGGSGLAYSGQSLYYANIDNRTIYEIDSITGDVTNTFIGPNGQIDALGFGTTSFGETLFSLQFGFGNARIHLVDPDTGALFSTVNTGLTLIGGMDYNPISGTLFVGEFGINDVLYELNPETGAVVNQFDAPSGATGIGFDGPRLFVSDREADAIFELNPTNGDIINSFPSPDDSPGALAGGDLAVIPEPFSSVFLALLAPLC